MSEQCGAPTTKGGKCQNDADSCPWHGVDNPPDNGRPSLLDEYKDDILVGARQGMALAGCARLAGIDESTLHRWINKYEDFRKSLKRARAQGELQHLQSVNDSGSRFILERSFGYTKSQEIEHQGEGAGIVINLDDESDD